jgi:class 3 adenylate cyclase
MRRPRCRGDRDPARLDTGPFAGQRALRTRIGINTGTVIGVTIGTDNRLNYTLLGDAVNIASRVEAAQQALRHRDPRHREHGARRRLLRLRAAGQTDVRGHRGNVVVYRVGPAHERDRTPARSRDPPPLSLMAIVGVASTRLHLIFIVMTAPGASRRARWAPASAAAA